VKTILAYGDSLTWGHDAEGMTRHAYEDRWPSVLQKALGHGVRVIPEGLGGRTTAYDDHLAPCERNGAKMLPTVLHSHAPLDLVILMLGTNDLKPVIAGSAHGAVKGMRRLVEIIQHHAWPFDFDGPEILIVSPPFVRETANADYAAGFGGAIEQSKMLSTFYRDMADETGCGFFDAASVAVASPVDGVHLDAENTRAIGRGLEPIVRMQLGF
jgi:lysophospholipase L1-like esterase